MKLSAEDKENQSECANSDSAMDLKVSAKKDGEEMTPALLDDIIERLVNYNNYEGYTINENKGGTTGNNLPYILKEKEIRLLIQAAETVFKE